MFLNTNAWGELQKLKNENRIERLYVQYNHELNRNRTVYVSVEVDGLQYEGVAKTHKDDQFVKAIGREIAAGRVLKKIKEVV